MRTLEKNEIKCWRVYPTIYVDEIDSEDFILEIRYHPLVYQLKFQFPCSINQPFGSECSFDMVISNDVVLDKDIVLHNANF